MRLPNLLLIPILCFVAVGRVLGDPGWDAWGVHFKSSELLDKGDFKELEAFATKLKANGYSILQEQPELGAFYGGLKLADDAPVALWPDRLAVIERWRAQFPDSLTARIAEVNWYLGYPGGSYSPPAASNAPPPEPFTVVAPPTDCVAKAAELLKAIPSEKIDDPEYYVDLLKVCDDQARPQEEMFEVLAKGIALAPEYVPLYMTAALYLMPFTFDHGKQGFSYGHGKPGQLEQQIKEWADQFPGTKGDVLYAYLLAYDESYHRLPHVDYARAKRGLLARLSDTNSTHWRDRDTLAILAGNQGDKDTMRKMFLANEGSAEIGRFSGQKEYMYLRAKCGAQALLDEAYSLERAGNLADAEKKLLSFTKDPEMYLPLEFFYERQGMEEKLMTMKITFSGKTVKEMASLDPGFAPADLLGELCSYYPMMGQWDKAEVAAQRFAQLRPENMIGKNILLLCAIKRGDARLAQQRVLDILRMKTDRRPYKHAQLVINGSSSWENERKVFSNNDPYNSQGITSIILFELSRGRSDIARQVIKDALPHCAENSGKAILQSLEYGSLARDLKPGLNPPPPPSPSPSPTMTATNVTTPVTGTNSVTTGTP